MCQRAITLLAERIGAFQDIILRQIVQQLLPRDHPPTFLSQELSCQSPHLPTLPEERYHIFCSTHNPGAEELISTLQRHHVPQLRFATDSKQLEACDHCLLYLNARTWNHDMVDTFAAELQQAIELGVHILLAWEAPGIDGCAPPRFACAFDDFFNETPAILMKAQLYQELATPLKPMPCRTASIMLLLKAMAATEPVSIGGSPLTLGCRTPQWIVSAGSIATREVNGS